MKKLINKNNISYLIFVGVVLVTAFIFNRLFEVLLFIICFNFMHDCFKKRFHANTIEEDYKKAGTLCKLITIIITLGYLILSISINTTLYINLSIIIGICFVNAMLQDYIELLDKHLDDEIKRAKNGNRIYRGMSMVELECSLSKYDIVGIPNDIMHYFYVDRMKLQDIADTLGYSIERIQQIKRDILNILTKEKD